ncbi:MAG: hypothetical protein ACRD2Y_16150 [Terriglobales bacterium]
MQETGFKQATIPIQNSAAFEELRGVVEAVLEQRPERLLRMLKRRRLTVREFERIAAQNVLEEVQDDRGWLARLASPPSAGRVAKLYGSLPVSDQAQFREYYLTRVEQIDDDLRGRYREAFWTY